ncbi:MAG: hypothetical protein A2177_13895, partial [Spirochaetes bacterium RBG_13_68_11]
LTLSCSLFDYSSVVTDRYALVYGVAMYAASAPAGVPPNLSCPALDAEDVAVMLAAAGYTVKSRWVDENGALYVDGILVGPVDPNVGEAPTKDNLQSDLASLSSLIGSTDEFVFYFSGHGMQNAGETHEFFVPYGGIAEGPPGSYYGDETASVRDDEMGTYLTESIGTPRRVVILDTCYSGGFIGNTLEVDTTPPTTSTAWRPGFSLSTIAKAIAAYASFTTDSSMGISAYQAQVLSAAGSGEPCYEDTGYGHGVMTYYLLETAGNGDLNGDGAVTVLEAFSLVKAGIEEDWNTEYPAAAFTPHISGGAVDFVLF